MKENILIIDSGNNYGTTTPFLERQIRQIKKRGTFGIDPESFYFYYSKSRVCFVLYPLSS